MGPVRGGTSLKGFCWPGKTTSYEAVTVYAEGTLAGATE